MDSLPEGLNPYEPPTAVGPMLGVARPIWVQLAFWGTKLPGLSARNSAWAWVGLDLVLGGFLVVGAGWISPRMNLRPEWSFTLVEVGGVVLVLAAGWIRAAIGWVDRHGGW